jgi:2-C-methyl-D-erythritol 2,4-cyclodiphosphate synthase
VSRTNQTLRIGFGVDIHQLVEGRPLVIGGVLVDSPFGALGHSDADVLLHAICDALLGALSLGDIGSHFPDTEPEFKGIDSKVLLKRTYNLIKEKGYSVGNIDSTVLLERPKLSLYVLEMRTQIAEILETEVSNVSVKATRGEGLGYIGEGRGIKAYCNVLLLKMNM